MSRDCNLIKLKRGLASEWNSLNPVLKLGEPGYEKDTKKLKIGDGVTLWNDLPYIGNDTIDFEDVQDEVASFLNAGSNIFLDYDDPNNILTISATGLQPSGNYSLVGHSHISSEITDFNSSVSGLLPVKNIIGSGNINVSNSNGSFTISSSGVTISNEANNRIITSDGLGGIVAESNLTFDGSLLSVSGSLVAVSGTYNQLIFNTSLPDPDLSQGQLQWNSTEGTLDLGFTDTYSQHMGEELHYRVRNNTASTLVKGTAVYASGLTPGGNNRIEVAPFTADGSVREVRFMGLVTENIAVGVNGYTTQFGYIRGIDTRGDAASNGYAGKLWDAGEPSWSEGDILYAHPTVAGKLTKVEPKHSISVAIVLNRHQNNGKIFVRPTSYGHLDDNHDVNVSGVTNGQYLQYNAATDYWVPTSSGIFTSLKINNFDVTNLSVASGLGNNDLLVAIIDPTGTPNTQVLQGSVLRSSLLNQPAVLRFRQGTEVERLLITPASGEPIWTTDSQRFYIGDGTTIGGDLIGPGPYSRGEGIDSIVVDNSGCVVVSDYSVILGGINNVIGSGSIDNTGGIPGNPQYSNIVGGSGNLIIGYPDSYGVVIGGGLNNSISAYSTGGLWDSENNIQFGGSTIAGGISNIIYFNTGGLGGPFNTIGGGCQNSMSTYGNGNTIGGGIGNNLGNAGSSNNTISGGSSNKICGSENYKQAYNNTIGGGSSNSIEGTEYGAWGATIAGGYLNTISSYYGGTIGGGKDNTTSGDYSTVCGGLNNSAKSTTSIVGGGYKNSVLQPFGSLVGGFNNLVNSSRSFIGGGSNNVIAQKVRRANTINSSTNTITVLNATASDFDDTTANALQIRYRIGNSETWNNTTRTVSSATQDNDNVILVVTNNVGASNPYQWTNVTIVNTAETDTTIGNVVGGGINNISIGNYSTVGGGFVNTSSGYYSTVGGGNSNTSSGFISTVGGGISNTSSGNYSTVSGGRNNTSSGYNSTVSGGYNNTSSGNYSTVSGGKYNTSSGYSSAVGGGGSNTSSGNYCTVAGGYNNTSSSFNSTVAGGNSNTSSGYSSAVGGGIYNTSSGNYSTVSGGKYNTSSGNYSTVPGGMQTKATRHGELSHAAGQFANNGDAQHTILIARRTTTNATANQVLFLNGSSARLTLSAETTWAFTIKLSAYNATDNQGGWWIFRGGIRRNAANGTALIGSLITESGTESSLSSASASVVADDTNEALEIRVTGVASKNIRWVAVVDISQVSYGTP